MANTTCNIDTLNPIEKALGKITANADERKNIFNSFYRGGNNPYDSEFLSYASARSNKNITSWTTDEVAKAMVDFYYEKHKSVSHTRRRNRSNDKVLNYGYTNANTRSEGLKHLAGFLLEIQHDVRIRNYEIPGDKLLYYAKRLKALWTNIIFDDIANRTGKSIADIQNEYKEAIDKTQYIKNKLDIVNSQVDANRFALYQELFCVDVDGKGLMDTGSYSKQFLKEVLVLNPNLSGLFNELKSSFDESATGIVADSNVDKNQDNPTDEDSSDSSDSNAVPTEYALDSMIFNAESHGGHFKNFMTHVSQDIRDYFSRLKKRTTANPDDFSYDTNNAFGIASRMDYIACCQQCVNGDIDYSSHQKMIESIKRIARQVAGFESFIQLAEDLTTDADFAKAFRTAFNKTKKVAIENRASEGENTTVVANSGSNKGAVMFLNAGKDLESFASEPDLKAFTKRKEQLEESINAVLTRVQTFEKNGYLSTYDEETKKPVAMSIQESKAVLSRDLAELKSKTIKLIQEVYPSFNSDAIDNYIESNNNSIDLLSKKINNIQTLLKCIKDVIDGINADNFAFRLEYDKLVNTKGAQSKEVKDFISRKRKESKFTLNLRGAATAIINELKHYSAVSTDNNSPNVHKNNQSDIINNNHINSFKRMSESFYEKDGQIRNDELEAWGRAKLALPQHTYSPFLLQRYYTTKDGQTIKQKGLFKKVGNDYVLTKDAPTLFRVYYYNGAANSDTNGVVNYNEMEEPDYLAATVFNLFNPAEEYGNNTPDSGIYFLRTPSDAGNTYQMRMPRIDCSSLLKYADPVAAEERIQRALTAYSNVLDPFETLKSFKNFAYLLNAADEQGNNQGLQFLRSANAVESKKTIEDIINNDGDLWVKNYRLLRLYERGKGNETVQGDSINHGDIVDCVVVTNDGYASIVRGVYAKEGRGAGLIRNAKYVGVLGYNFAINNEGQPKHGFTKFDKVDTTTSTLYRALHDKVEYDLLRGDVDINGQHFDRLTKVMDDKHPMAQILINQFKQELLDAAVALDHFFEYESLKDKNGNVVLDENGRPVEVVKLEGNLPKLKAKFKDKLRGINWYHLQNGKLFDVGDDGYAKLLGNVFHSTKFSLQGVNAKGQTITTNFLEDLISKDSNDVDKGKINLLYGVSTGTNLRFIRDQKGNVIDIALTDAQNEAITKAIEQFVNQAVSDVLNFAEPYNDILSKAGADLTISAAEYALNYFVFYCVSDEILEGNPKFYKNREAIALTLLKRAKEDQGSGISYSNSTYDGAVKNVDETIPGSESLLNGGTVSREVTTKNEQGKSITTTEDISVQTMFTNWELKDLVGVKERKGFRAVTIANSKNSRNAQFDSIIEVLASIYHDSGNYTWKVARQRAATLVYGPIQFNADGTEKKDKDGEPLRKGGFTDTKINDAQSYITIQEFVRRVAAKGQLRRYLPVLEKIMNPTKYPKLTAEDLNEFVQVQKNFYYDLYADERYNIERPRQIKNAEFVLVPRFIEGTQLMGIYNLMQEAGIDQLNTVETSKASNEEVMKIWDNDGNFDIWNEDGTENADKKKAIVNQIKTNAEPYWYENLYSQQETPQHMNETNKVGIQLYKKMLDNIPSNGHPLSGIKSMIFDLMSINVEDAKIEICKELGIPLTANGDIDIKVAPDGTIKGLWDIDIDTPPEKIAEITKCKKVVYDRLYSEMLRDGIDSNTKDYVTLDEINQPLMPITHNVLVKLENVIQGMFNHNITRQTFKGSHMAQVTNVGWKTIRETIDENTGNKSLDSNTTVQYDKSGKLKYHPVYKEKGKTKVKGYVEVMLPLSFLGIDRNSDHYRDMSLNQIWKELDKKGLLDIIGYRIPTEGKQSICYMKVAKFLDDSQGSTIIVPDEWVAQTGSDFDIDSVYTVQFNTRLDASGEIHKIEYKGLDKNGKTLFNECDYYSYIFNKLRGKNYNSELKNELTNGVKQFKEEYAKIKDRQHEDINAIYKEINAIDPTLGDKLEAVRKAVNNQLKQSGLDGLDRRLARAKKLKKSISPLAKNYRTLAAKAKNEEQKDRINKTADLLERLVKAQTDILDDSKAIQSITSDKLALFSSIAKKCGLLTYEEFIHPDNVKIANTKEARDNAILNGMIAIMNHPTSLEENLMRSNFDKITLAREKYMGDDAKAVRDAYSAHSVISQIRMHTDAMSGRNLKAVSVVLDTMCSVCNTVRPFIEYPITCIYTENESVKYKDVKKAYVRDCGDIDKETGEFAVRHRRYGWSETNYNVDGDLIPPYSSQTTALALDTIKEGGIPNVNLYSFSTFKTLVNLGVPFDLAVPFMMQPAITRIINNTSISGSIYNDQAKQNPIFKALRDIANEIYELDTGVSDYFTESSINDIMDTLNTRYNKQFNALCSFKNAINIDSGHYRSVDIPLNQKLIAERIKNKGDKFKGNSKKAKMNRLLFDLGNVLAFNNIKLIADEIMKNARCANPDKFGAKETLFETRKVLEDINELLWEKELLTEDLKSKEDKKEEKGKKSAFKITKSGTYYIKRRRSIFKAKNKDNEIVDFIEALYPGCSSPVEGIDGMMSSMLKEHSVDESSYPILYAYLRNATISSILIGRAILDTETPTMIDIVEGIKSVFSGANPTLDVATYKNFQKYFLTYLYQRAPFVTRRVTARLKDGKVELGYDTGVTEEEELNRIAGFNYSPALLATDKNEEKVDFKVKNVYEPTDDEMELFETLSAAQKVHFIKQNFENPGIFGFLNDALYNTKSDGKKRENKQTISYLNQNYDENSIYAMFDDAFFNDSPLIVSAALDVIKYSIIVEGFGFNKTSPVKCISNEALKSSEFEDGNNISIDGLGFGKYIYDQYNDINNSTFSDNQKEHLYELYLRSHPKVKGINTVSLTSKLRQKTKVFEVSGMHGMLVLYPMSSGTAKEKRSDINSRLKHLGVAYEHETTGGYGYNQYIRLVQNDNSVLYKVKIVYNTENNINCVFLYPLGNLNENETTDYSLDPKNNKVDYRYEDEDTGQYKYRKENIYVSDVYENIINEYVKDKNFNVSSSSVTDEYIEQLLATHKIQYRWYEPPVEFDEIIPTINFDINLEAEKYVAWENLRNAIINHFNGRINIKNDPNNSLFVRFGPLDSFIRMYGITFASKQSITLPDGKTIDVKIEKVNLDGGKNSRFTYDKGIKKNFLDPAGRNLDVDKVAEVDPNTVKDKGFRELATFVKNDSIRNLIKSAKELNVTDMKTSLYEISINDDNIADQATLSEANIYSLHAADNLYSNFNDKDSMELGQNLKRNGIQANAQDLEEHSSLVNSEIAKWAEATSNRLDDDFNKFDKIIEPVEDGDDIVHLVKMSDPEALKLVSEDKNKERQFKSVINAVRSLRKDLAIYKQVTLDENSSSEDKFALKKVLRALDKIEALDVDYCATAYNQHMAMKESGNPLIREGLLDVGEGYWRTTGQLWKLDDIAENGTPLLQLLLKEIMDSTEAKIQKGDEDARAFDKLIKRISQQGFEEHGERVDLSKIVRKGKITQDYSDKLEKTLRELTDKRKDALQKVGQLTGDRVWASQEYHDYLVADLEYSEFVAAHFEQEVDKDYYDRKNHNRRYMLEHNWRLLALYQTLKDRQRELFKLMGDDQLTTDLADELYKVQRKLYSLDFIGSAEHPGLYLDDNDEWQPRMAPPTSETVYDESYTGDLPQLAPINYNKMSEFFALNSDGAASLLHGYLQAMTDLENEYFDKNGVFGFQEQLEENLRIISSYEQIDPNTGIYKTPTNVLNSIPQYIKAKKWIKNNAKWVYPKDLPENSTGDASEGDVTIFTEINRALIRRKLGRNAKPSAVQEIIRRIASEKQIYDELGRIDATKLTTEEIQEIANATNAAYQNGIGLNTLKRLLTARRPDGVIYTQTFYSAFLWNKSEEKNDEYQTILNEIVDTLLKYCNARTGSFDLATMKDDAKGLTTEQAANDSLTYKTLKYLGSLFQQLRQTNSRYNLDATPEDQPDWVKNIVEHSSSETDMDAFTDFVRSCKRFSDPIKDVLIEEILYERHEDGSIRFDKNGEAIPNRYLFSVLKPDESIAEDYIDHQAMRDNELIANAFLYQYTPYYFDAKAEAEKNGVNTQEAKDWYNANHFYNPYTNRVEPLPCWVKTTPNTEWWNSHETTMVFNPVTGAVEHKAFGYYAPKGKQIERKPKFNKVNKNFKEGLGRLANYRKDGSEYDNNIVLNDTERKIKEALEEKLLSTAKTNQSIAYFGRGGAPKVAKEDKMSVKEKFKQSAMLFGAYFPSDSAQKAYKTKFGFAADEVVSMPMTTELTNELTREYDTKIEELIVPDKASFANETEYNNAVNEYEKQKAYYEEQKKIAQDAMIDDDWLTTTVNYIKQAARTNAVLDNKQNVYYLYDEICRMQMYNREHGMAGGNLKKNRDGTFDTSVDENLIKQLQVFMNRYLYNQWKENDGKLNTIANSLQSFASANYMTFNLKGGIGNVTLGLQGIFGERLASEYFQHWKAGQAEYFKGITSYHRRAYNEMMGKGDQSYSLQDAIIKRFNVVDYDEVSGVVRGTNLKRVSEGIRNFTYSLQTMGEHYMQNTVLFSMLMSHKIIQIEDGRHTFMNREEYIRYKQGDIIKSILTDEQLRSFEEWKNQIKEDKDFGKEFFWWRKDVLSEWLIRHCNAEQRDKIAEAFEKERDRHLEDFNKVENMYTQLTLKDGYLGFVDGSDLARLEAEQYKNDDVNVAQQLIGSFTERVRKVNNKIHGVYNKMGAAYIEKTWWGSLVMQYHKHFPIGLLKRYRRRGLFNETRGTVEKGLLTSLIDFISMDVRLLKADNKLTNENLNALQGIQFMFANCFRFFTNMGATWRILPQRERSNILRNLGDFVGTIGALALLTLLWLGGSDDDDWKENIFFNLGIYELDRLASESFMYNPVGLLAETKKLTSTPVAAQSIVSDAFNSLTAIGSALFGSLFSDEEYDFYYKSGRFAGQNKLWVYLQRRIPMYSAIHGIFDLTDSNQYYKVGDTATTLVNPKKLAERIKGN